MAINGITTSQLSLFAAQSVAGRRSSLEHLLGGANPVQTAIRSLGILANVGAAKPAFTPSSLLGGTSLTNLAVVAQLLSQGGAASVAAKPVTPPAAAFVPPPAPPATPVVPLPSSPASVVVVPAPPPVAAPTTSAPATSTAPATTSAPSVTAAAAPAADGSLKILLSGDTDVGPTQFRVLVDGKDVTGVISTDAQHGKGEYKTLTIDGQFADAKTIDIQKVGGSALYVKQIEVGGRSYQSVDAAFSRFGAAFTAGTGREAIYWNDGDLHFATSTTAPSTQPPVTLSSPATGLPPVTPPAPGQGLSLTISANGAPEFRILVDGQDVTGRITATANSSKGEYQTVTLAGDFSNAKTIDVQMMNYLDGALSGTPTTLFVKSLSVNGETLQAKDGMFTRTYDANTPVFSPGTGTEALFWNGTLRFSPASTPVTVPPPPPPVTVPPPPPPVTVPPPPPPVTVPPPPPPVTVPPPPPPGPVGHTLTVGAGQQYSTIQAAVNAAQNGDTIAIQAGTYVDQTATINKDVTIKAVGGPVTLTETHNISNGKAYFVVNGNVTVDGITFQGATVASGNNGAGIRFETGNLTVKNSTFTGNQEGILTTNTAGLNLTVDSSTFLNNGAGDGFSHGIYAGRIASLTVTNSQFEGTKVGHDIKSRALNTTITNNTFDDDATASYAIDLPEAGNGTIANNVIAKGASAQNVAAIHYGGEASNAGSLSITNNTIVNQKSGGVAVRNDASSGQTVTLRGNYIYGESALANGSFAANVATTGNTVSSTAPGHLPLPSGYGGSGTPVFHNLLSTFHLSV